MGTPGFAAPSLKRLFDDGHDIAGVFTQPDKPRSRGMKVSFSPVKELALAHGTPVFQLLTLKDGQAEEILHKLNCDIIAVVAYGKILTREILGIPPYGCVNVHGSVLPKYRGAAPIQWAIINGERETGVTTMYMAEEMDAGDILLSKALEIGENETSDQLYDRLSILGAELLSETIQAISVGKISRIPQIHEEATFAPPLSKSMSPIDWNESAFAIKCKVRGLAPWPAATAELGGAVCKIYSVDITDKKTMKKNGEVVSAGEAGLEVACEGGTVIIKELQAPGGKRMAASEYLKGHKIGSQCRTST